MNIKEGHPRRFISPLIPLRFFFYHPFQPISPPSPPFLILDSLSLFFDAIWRSSPVALPGCRFNKNGIWKAWGFNTQTYRAELSLIVISWKKSISCLLFFELPFEKNTWSDCKSPQQLLGSRRRLHDTGKAFIYFWGYAPHIITNTNKLKPNQRENFDLILQQKYKKHSIQHSLDKLPP